jgi:hypothetical protein
MIFAPVTVPVSGNLQSCGCPLLTDVKPNEHDVVGEKHKSREVISNRILSQGIVSEVADVLNLWIPIPVSNSVALRAPRLRTS